MSLLSGNHRGLGHPGPRGRFGLGSRNTRAEQTESAREPLGEKVQPSNEKAESPTDTKPIKREATT